MLLRALLVFVVCFVCVECGATVAMQYAPGDGDYDSVTADCCEPFETYEHHDFEIDQGICTYMIDTYCSRNILRCALLLKIHECCPYRGEEGELCRCDDEESKCYFPPLWRNLASLKGVCEKPDQPLYTCTKSLPPPTK